MIFQWSSIHGQDVWITYAGSRDDAGAERALKVLVPHRRGQQSSIYQHATLHYSEMLSPPTHSGTAIAASRQ